MIYEMNKYSEFIVAHRPTLHIFLHHLKMLIKALHAHINQVTPEGVGDGESHDDYVHMNSSSLCVTVDEATMTDAALSDRLRQLIISCHTLGPSIETEKSLTLVLQPLPARVIDSKAEKNHLFIQCELYT
jgi:hypothetical protein